jgi:hypothetical protein
MNRLDVLIEINFLTCRIVTTRALVGPWVQFPVNHTNMHLKLRTKCGGKITLITFVVLNFCLNGRYVPLEIHFSMTSVVTIRTLL